MKTNNSGSIDTSIFDLIKEGLEDLMVKLDASKKFYTLKPPEEGFDYHWFFDAKTKTLERFNSGIHIEILEDFDEDSYLCMYKDKTIIVKKDKIGREVEH